MQPAFPDIVGQWAARTIDRKARIWCLTRGADGEFEERLDRIILAALGDASSGEDIIDALVIAAAEQDIAETRDW